MRLATAKQVAYLVSLGVSRSSAATMTVQQASAKIAALKGSPAKQASAKDNAERISRAKIRDFHSARRAERRDREYGYAVDSWGDWA